MALAPEIQVEPRDGNFRGSAHRVREVALSRRYHVDTPFRQVRRGVGRAAVAGFGLSLGRDLYRLAKRLAALTLCAAIPFLWIILPFLAGRLLVRRKGMWDYVVGIPAFIVGALACVAAAAYLTDFQMTESLIPRSIEVLLMQAFLLFAAGFTLGSYRALGDRALQSAASTIAERNSDFFHRHGIRETGGRQVTHYDGQNNPLRFLEAHNDRLLFMVVGARGRRAQIMLDEDGSMRSYSGVF